MPIIPLKNISEIPFLDHGNLERRSISTLTFYDKGEWHVWIPTQEGLVKIKAFPAEQHFFSNEPLEGDLFLHFLDFFEQRISMRELHGQLYAIKDDVLNLAASLAKIEFLYRMRKEPDISSGMRRLIATEIEFIFTTCRSMFDLLQECAQILWDCVKLQDVSISKRSLEKNFSAMAFTKDGRTRTKEELITTFGLPPAWAEIYFSNADFFGKLRKFRNEIVHRGGILETIFDTEKGFALSGDTEPFSGFKIWNQEHRQANSLCSLKPALGYVVGRTIGACENFSRAIESCIGCSSPLAPDFKVYIRGEFLDVLHQNINTIERCLWYGEV